MKRNNEVCRGRCAQMNPKTKIVLVTPYSSERNQTGTQGKIEKRVSMGMMAVLIILMLVVRL